MKKEIKLSRIHCAGCAASLEEKIKQVKGVKSASLDFISKTISLETENKNSREIICNVEKCIKKFDGSIKIINNDQEDNDQKRQKIAEIIEVSRIILSVINGSRTISS